jgi:hypothetical protein
MFACWILCRDDTMWVIYPSFPFNKIKLSHIFLSYSKRCYLLNQKATNLLWQWEGNGLLCWENKKWSTIDLCMTYSKARILGAKNLGRLNGSCSKPYTMMIVWSFVRYQSLVLASFFNHRVCLIYGMTLGSGVPCIRVYMALMYLFTYRFKPLFFSFLLIS